MSVRPTDNPAAYGVLAKALLAAFVISGVVDLSGDAVQAWNIVADAIIGLFVVSSVNTRATTRRRVADAQVAARDKAFADIASLAPLKRAVKK